MSLGSNSTAQHATAQHSMTGQIFFDGHAAEISSCDLQQCKAGMFVVYLDHCMTCLQLACNHARQTPPLMPAVDILSTSN
jgi:hypothetical protein